MFTREPTVKLTFTYRDREGRAGSISSYLPYFTSQETVNAWITLYSSWVNDLTDAVLVKVKQEYNARDPDAVLPETALDMHAFVVLFYKLEEKVEAIKIPAPKGELFETQGDYQSVRVDPSSLLLASWVDNWNDIQAGISTPEGEEFPSEYLVGGKML